MHHANEFPFPRILRISRTNDADQSRASVTSVKPSQRYSSLRADDASFLCSTVAPNQIREFAVRLSLRQRGDYAAIETYAA